MSSLSGSRLVDLDVRLCIRVIEGTGTETGDVSPF
jgi:hypothetical protein